MAAPNTPVLIAAVLTCMIVSALAGPCSKTMGGATSFAEAAPQHVVQSASGATAYAAVGSGAGITGFIANTYCIGVSDATLNGAQNAAAGGTAKWTIPLAIASYGFYLGGTKTAVVKMSEMDTYKVFFSGTSTNTIGGLADSYLPATLKTTTIIPVARSDNSGTTEVVKKFWATAKVATVGLVDDKPFNAPGLGPFSRNTVFKSGGQPLCATVASKLGYVGYSQVGLCKDLTTSEIQVKNAAGRYIAAGAPTTTVDAVVGRVNLARDTSWAAVSTVYIGGPTTPPVASFIFSFTKKTAPGGTADGTRVKKLLTFIMSAKGQNINKAVGFDLLPPSVISKNIQAISTIK